MKKIKKNLTKKMLAALSIGLLTTGIVITTTACFGKKTNANVRNVINTENNIVLPSNIQLSNKEAIKNFIVAYKDKLFSKTDLEKSADITKLDIIVQNDQAILSFMIKDEFVSNLRIKLSKESQTLELNQTYNVKLDSTFNNDSNSAVETIKQTIFKNKETIFLKGTIVDVSDIIVKSNVLNSTKDKINVNVTIYGQNFNITLGLTPKTPTTGNVLDEINTSGQTNNISASAYWGVVDKLGLNFLNAVSAYTDADLNAKLAAISELSSINVKISNGSSDLTGVLELELTGTYKNVAIPANTIVTVKGFIDYSSPNAINVKTYELDEKAVFEASQTQADVSNWTKEQWTQYSKSINLELITSLGSVTTSFEQTKTLLNQQYLQTTFDATNLKIKYNIDAKEMTNGAWTVKEKIQKETNVITDLSINETAALNYIIGYKTKLVTKEHSTEYASLYYSKYKSPENTAEKENGKYFLESSMTAQEQTDFLTKYFPNQNTKDSIGFAIPENGFFIDDFNGKVKFNAYAFYGDQASETQRSTKQKLFEVSGFKKLSALQTATDSIVFQSGKFIAEAKKLKPTKAALKADTEKLKERKLAGETGTLTAVDPKAFLIGTESEPNATSLNLYDFNMDIEKRKTTLKTTQGLFSTGKINIFKDTTKLGFFKAIDPVTGLYNKQFFIQSASIKIDTSKAHTLTYDTTTEFFIYTLPVIVEITYAPNQYDQSTTSKFEYKDFEIVSNWTEKTLYE